MAKKEQPREVTIETSPSAQRLLAKVLGDIQETKKQRQVLAGREADLQDRLTHMLVMYMEGSGNSFDDFNIVEYEDHGRSFKIVKRDA